MLKMKYKRKQIMKTKFKEHALLYWKKCDYKTHIMTDKQVEDYQGYSIALSFMYEFIVGVTILSRQRNFAEHLNTSHFTLNSDKEKHIDLAKKRIRSLLQDEVLAEITEEQEVLLQARLDKIDSIVKNHRTRVEVKLRIIAEHDRINAESLTL